MVLLIVAANVLEGKDSEEEKASAEKEIDREIRERDTNRVVREGEGYT